MNTDDHQNEFVNIIARFAVYTDKRLPDKEVYLGI